MAVERFPVEASHILMFARSIGDSNPIYADESHAAGTEVGSIIAPPTFAQASAQFDPDYFLRPKDGQKWFGSGGTASGTWVYASGVWEEESKIFPPFPTIGGQPDNSDDFGDNVQLENDTLIVGERKGGAGF